MQLTDNPEQHGGLWQVFCILRGCAGTYLVVAVLGWLIEVSFVTADRPSMFTPAETLIVYLVYGGFFAVLVTLFILMVWAVLAWAELRVHAAAAPLTAMALAITLFGRPDGVDPVTIMLTILVGSGIGALFWYFAFGTQKRVLMAWQATPIRDTLPKA